MYDKVCMSHLSTLHLDVVKEKQGLLWHQRLLDPWRLVAARRSCDRDKVQSFGKQEVRHCGRCLGVGQLGSKILFHVPLFLGATIFEPANTKCNKMDDLAYKYQSHPH